MKMQPKHVAAKMATDSVCKEREIYLSIPLGVWFGSAGKMRSVSGNYWKLNKEIDPTIIISV